MLSLQSSSSPISRLVLVLACGVATIAVASIIASGDIQILEIALLAGVALALSLVPIWWAILIYFTYSAFSPLLKFVGSYSTIVHLGPDIVLAPILLHWFATRAGHKGTGLAGLPLARLVGAFVVVACLMVFAPMTTPLVGLGGILTYVLPIVFFPLAFAELRSRKRIYAFLVLTIALSSIGAILTIVFVILGPQRVAAFGPAFATVALSPSNIYFDANGRNTGWIPLQVVSGVVGYMVALVLLVTVLVRSGKIMRQTAIIAVAAPVVVLLAASLFVSGVRLTIAGAAVGILVVALAGRRRAILPTLIGFVLVIIALNVVGNLTNGAAVIRAATLLNPTQAFQSSGRTSLLQQIIPLALNNPLGQGMGRIGPGSQAVIGAAGSSITSIGADNMLIAIISELGISGGFLLSAIAVMFVVQGWRVYRRLSDPGLKSIALGCTAASITLTASWLAGPTLMQAPGSIYFWALAGLCFALPHVEAQERQES